MKKITPKNGNVGPNGPEAPTGSGVSGKPNDQDSARNRMVDEIRTLLGPLVNALARDTAGALRLDRVPSKDVYSFQDWIVSQAGIDDKKSFSAPYKSLLSEQKYFKLFQFLYQAANPEFKCTVTPWQADALAKELQGELIKIDGQSFASRNFSTKDGRLRMAGVLRGKEFYDKEVRAELLKGIEKAAVGVLGEATVEMFLAAELDIDLGVFSVQDWWNVFITDENIDRATAAALNMLRSAEQVYAANEKKEQGYGTRDDGLFAGIKNTEVKKYAEISKLKQNNARSNIQIQSQLADLWLLAAHDVNWQGGHFERGHVTGARQFIINETERLMGLAASVKTEQGMVTLSENLQEFLKGSMYLDGGGLMAAAEHFMGNTGLESFFKDAPDLLRTPYDNLVQYADEMKYAKEMGETLHCAARSKVPDEKLGRDINNLIHAIAKTMRTLWYSYKQHPALSRMISQWGENKGVGNDVHDIESANRKLDALIWKIAGAKSKEELEPSIKELYNLLGPEGLLTKALTAAESDGVEMTIGFAQTMLEIVATSVVSAGAGAVIKMARVARAARFAKVAGKAVEAAGVATGGEKAVAAARAIKLTRSAQKAEQAANAMTHAGEAAAFQQAEKAGKLAKMARAGADEALKAARLAKGTKEAGGLALRAMKLVKKADGAEKKAAAMTKAAEAARAARVARASQLARTAEGAVEVAGQTGAKFKDAAKLAKAAQGVQKTADVMTKTAEALGSAEKLSRGAKAVRAVSEKTEEGWEAFKMGFNMQFAHNTLALESGEVRQGSEKVLCWFKDAMATGFSMSFSTFAQASGSLGKHALKRFADRYNPVRVSSLLHMSTDTFMEIVEEMVDAYARQALDGHVDAMTENEFDDIWKLCLIGGGLKPGMIKAIIEGKGGHGGVDAGNKEAKVPMPSSLSQGAIESSNSDQGVGADSATKTGVVSMVAASAATLVAGAAEAANVGGVVQAVHDHGVVAGALVFLTGAGLSLFGVGKYKASEKINTMKDVQGIAEILVGTKDTEVFHSITQHIFLAYESGRLTKKQINQMLGLLQENRASVKTAIVVNELLEQTDTKLTYDSKGLSIRDPKVREEYLKVLRWVNQYAPDFAAPPVGLMKRPAGWEKAEYRFNYDSNSLAINDDLADLIRKEDGFERIIISKNGKTIPIKIQKSKLANGNTMIEFVDPDGNSIASVEATDGQFPDAKTDKAFRGMGLYSELMEQVLKGQKEVKSFVIHKETVAQMYKKKMHGATEAELIDEFRKTPIGRTREKLGFTRHRIIEIDKNSMEVRSFADKHDTDSDVGPIQDAVADSVSHDTNHTVKTQPFAHGALLEDVLPIPFRKNDYIQVTLEDGTVKRGYFSHKENNQKFVFFEKAEGSTALGTPFVVGPSAELSVLSRHPMSGDPVIVTTLPEHGVYPFTFISDEGDAYILAAADVIPFKAPKTEYTNPRVVSPTLGRVIKIVCDGRVIEGKVVNENERTITIEGVGNPVAKADLDYRTLVYLDGYPAEYAVVHELYPEGFGAHIQQGDVGSCYVLAPLHSFKQSPAQLANLIQRTVKREGNIWKVEFLEYPGEVVEIAQGELDAYYADLQEGKREALKGSPGDLLMEYAYGKLRIQKGFVPQGTSVASAVERGGLAEFVRAWTGREQVLIGGVSASKNQESLAQSNDALTIEVFNWALQVKAHHPDVLMLAATPNVKTPYESGGVFYMDPEFRFVVGHAYAVTGVSVDGTGKNITINIVNSHDTTNIITLTPDEFKNYFCQLSVDSGTLANEGVASEVPDGTLLGTADAHVDGDLPSDQAAPMIEKGASQYVGDNPPVDGAVQIVKGGQIIVGARSDAGEGRLSLAEMRKQADKARIEYDQNKSKVKETEWRSVEKLMELYGVQGPLMVHLQSKALIFYHQIRSQLDGLTDGEIKGLGFKDREEASLRLLDNFTVMSNLKEKGVFLDELPDYFSLESLRELAQARRYYAPTQAFTTGTSSSALPGMLRDGGIVALGATARDGQTPFYYFAGEQGFYIMSQQSGMPHVNDRGISMVQIYTSSSTPPRMSLDDKGNIDLKYAYAPGGWEPSSSNRLFWGVPEEYERAYALSAELYRRKLDAWDLLAEDEKQMVREGFPMIVQLRNYDKSKKIRIGQSDIKGEISYEGPINFASEDLEVFVPREKVASVAEQFKKKGYTRVKVLSLEGLETARFLYSNSTPGRGNDSFIYPHSGYYKTTGPQIQVVKVEAAYVPQRVATLFEGGRMDEVVIGKKGHIPIENPNASLADLQATIRRKKYYGNDSYEIEDGAWKNAMTHGHKTWINSDNGTYVNGIKLEPRKPQQLHDGDIITVADHEFVWKEPAK
ncbi:MAG: FHA domain-containing protein [Deltaproteobacteria bacterium]|nr:FHA domain-containing protein [Deltaproteobacteria bacterium]